MTDVQVTLLNNRLALIEHYPRDLTTRRLVGPNRQSVCNVNEHSAFKHWTVRANLIISRAFSMNNIGPSVS